MRPGQAAPECLVPPSLNIQAQHASMRPGQAAPECWHHPLYKTWLSMASMRPGQAAPECLKKEAASYDETTGFNEAGAGCPGMPCFVHVDTALSS